MTARVGAITLIVAPSLVPEVTTRRAIVAEVSSVSSVRAIAVVIALFVSPRVLAATHTPILVSAFIIDALLFLLGLLFPGLLDFFGSLGSFGSGLGPEFHGNRGISNLRIVQLGNGLDCEFRVFVSNDGDSLIIKPWTGRGRRKARCTAIGFQACRITC